MIKDVGTTPRKPLTPRQRLALFELRKGICSLCGRPIQPGERWIDEHMRALGLGGSNDTDNRGIAHEACAHAKTHGASGDLASIAKAKRSKQAHLGIKGAKTGMEGRSQEEKRAVKEEKTKAAGKTSLPPRSLFRDAKPHELEQMQPRLPPVTKMLALPAPDKKKRGRPKKGLQPF